jgi:FlaA1/EpsC-like NDP-sugar epimerase
MGATKMVMEKVLLARSETQPFATARLANVAFSDGSLPYGFLRRIDKHQPLSAPNDVKRYFISHREAGDLCILACVLGANRDVFFPKLAEETNEKTFSQIAMNLLDALGYEAVECGSEEEARSRATELIPKKKWPCHFFTTDTTGEKGYEEFHAAGEQTDMTRFKNIGVVKRGPSAETEVLDAFVQFCRDAKTDSRITKNDYVEAMLRIVPALRHVETGKTLDNKM